MTRLTIPTHIQNTRALSTITEHPPRIPPTNHWSRQHPAKPNDGLSAEQPAKTARLDQKQAPLSIRTPVDKAPTLTPHETLPSAGWSLLYPKSPSEYLHSGAIEPVFPVEKMLMAFGLVKTAYAAARATLTHNSVLSLLTAIPVSGGIMLDSISDLLSDPHAKGRHPWLETALNIEPREPDFGQDAAPHLDFDHIKKSVARIRQNPVGYSLLFELDQRAQKGQQTYIISSNLSHLNTRSHEVVAGQARLLSGTPSRGLAVIASNINWNVLDSIQLDATIFHELTHVLYLLDGKWNESAHNTAPEHDRVLRRTNEFLLAANQPPKYGLKAPPRPLRDIPMAHLLEHGISATDIYRLTKANDFGKRILDAYKLMDGNGAMEATDGRHMLGKVISLIAQHEHGRDLLIQTYYANKHRPGTRIRLHLATDNNSDAVSTLQWLPNDNNTPSHQPSAVVYILGKKDYSDHDLVAIAGNIAAAASGVSPTLSEQSAHSPLIRRYQALEREIKTGSP